MILGAYVFVNKDEGFIFFFLAYSSRIWLIQLPCGLDELLSPDDNWFSLIII